ncbi:MAG: cobalamin-binding protein [Pseudomonadota bacterium]
MNYAVVPAIALFFISWLTPVLAEASVSVQDDAGTTITLAQPAKRVVSLAPHVTEMLYAAGGEGRIVGAVNYSDYPAAALALPRVGDHHRLDLERILALKPDLLVVWLHGGAARQMEPLRKLGIPLYYNDPRRLEDISKTVEQLGRLMGTETQAQATASGVRQQLAELGSRYRNRSPVRVFYQVWDQPLYTLNGETILSDVIRLCGGENVFASLVIKAPVVGIEAVIAENPEAIFSGDSRNRSNSALERWKSFPSLAAVRQGNLFLVNADLLNRATPRIVAGATDMCEKMEQARSRRPLAQSRP